MVPGESHADLFGGLPDRGGEQVIVVRLPASARKRHVARPRIAHPLGPADEKDGVGSGRHNDRHRGPTKALGVGIGPRPVGGEALPQPVETDGQWL
jgi:hypothetical protein